MKFLLVLTIICLCLGTVLSSISPNPKPYKYNAIFNFGDSLSDTGNCLLLSGGPGSQAVGKLPYGETFFGRPTGRFSDGRLMIDFIAEAFGLPYLPPYVAVSKGQDDYHLGVNFAVGGATALDAEFFYQRNMGSLMSTNHSLTEQLGWFNKLKSSLCNTKQECKEFFKKSLFLVGEIGGNDYNYPFFSGQRNIEKLKPLVPIVVKAIANAVTALIEAGAVELVVPGNLPIGCSTVYLSLFETPDTKKYDPKTGCLKDLNDFSKYHNRYLNHKLETLRLKYPHAKIMYADYYGAAMQYFNMPKKYGFTNGVLKACCGGEGPYNFNILVSCGQSGSTVCKDPSTFANWDGVHLTEAAYRVIAQALINGTFVTPPLLS